MVKPFDCVEVRLKRKRFYRNTEKLTSMGDIVATVAPGHDIGM
jgi:hypothetical protein